MKTPKEWLRELAMAGMQHPPDCKCDRCRYGEHCVLVESDIREIQQSACKPLVESLENIMACEFTASRRSNKDKIMNHKFMLALNDGFHVLRAHKKHHHQ